MGCGASSPEKEHGRLKTVVKDRASRHSSSGRPLNKYEAANREVPAPKLVVEDLGSCRESSDVTKLSNFANGDMQDRSSKANAHKALETQENTKFVQGRQVGYTKGDTLAVEETPGRKSRVPSDAASVALSHVSEEPLGEGFLIPLEKDNDGRRYRGRGSIGRKQYATSARHQTLSQEQFRVIKDRRVSEDFMLLKTIGHGNEV